METAEIENGSESKNVHPKSVLNRTKLNHNRKPTESNHNILVNYLFDPIKTRIVS